MKKIPIIVLSVPVVQYLALAVQCVLLQEILIVLSVLKQHVVKQFQLHVVLRTYGAPAAVLLICIFMTLEIMS